MSFKYFAYGSNLSGYRLSESCQSKKILCCAKLTGYNLTFAKFAEQWQGGVASIQKSENPGNFIWGIIWEIADNEEQNLDDQEGVKQGHYEPIHVEVKTATGEVHKCKTYELMDLGGRHKFSDPSPQYLKTIYDGAVINKLPSEYIEKLANIPTNGNTVVTDFMRKIEKLKEEQSE